MIVGNVHKIHFGGGRKVEREINLVVFLCSLCASQLSLPKGLFISCVYGFV